MTRCCEMCPEAFARPATLFCAADACYLCAACDEVVHSANRLASRHYRSPIKPDEMDGSSINDDSDVGLVPDVTVPDARADVSSRFLDIPTDVACFEDTAEYDFCNFDIGGKMPSLNVIDEEGMWSDKMGRNMEFSWESVVGDSFEHVVPDIERDYKSKPVKAEVRVASVSSTLGKAVKVKVEEVSGAVLGGVKKEMVSVEQANASLGGGSCEQREDEEAAMERRKKRRMEALARFRSKRANRSFTKKVRYECRKQLADSRPRVKGRFVRKMEMALFRKYGNMYREHLDELNDGSTEQCVPCL